MRMKTSQETTISFNISKNEELFMSHTTNVLSVDTYIHTQHTGISYMYIYVGANVSVFMRGYILNCKVFYGPLCLSSSVV